ncbi:hypothetical protein QJS10_CPA16g00430 [Acorus calamus]|uniref:PB1 domain-containing protein n=1 Tax=Acorus calamus TaxID=4465 RepID=A0AAV9D0D1_ACOCL|nr:hypothetical protein QJS10_CPA16g00430 [Acorus calamus]
MVGSFDETNSKPTSSTIKFLCSYGGKILPRYSDGKLRYVGGDTRVLAVDRSIPFAELSVKLNELCGTSPVSLRCQLPTEDLDDALVSVTSDEDLLNLVEEYDRASRERSDPLKIRAFLFPPRSKTSSSSLSPPHTPETRRASPPLDGGSTVGVHRCVRQMSSSAVHPVRIIARSEKSVMVDPRYHHHQHGCGNSFSEGGWRPWQAFG